MTAVKPKCRYCGTRVPHFGAICSGCLGDQTQDEAEDAYANGWNPDGSPR